jgi:hypothetical protein
MAEISHWQDTFEIYNAVMDEINDINVAKIDGILLGTEAHNCYLNAFSMFKQNWGEARAISQAL